MNWELAAYCWASGMCGAIYVGSTSRWLDALAVTAGIFFIGMAGRYPCN